MKVLTQTCPSFTIVLSIGFTFLASLKTTFAEDPKIEQFLNCLQTQFDLDPSFYAYTQGSNLTYYNLLNRQWNTRKVPTTPLAYFVPQSTFHVQFAVKCGRASQLPLIPNSGGHSYEAISYGDNSTVVIDFREMKNLEVSEDGTIVTMQPGLLLGPMLSQLWSAAKVSLPVGNCLSVGLGGHAVGGGIGFYSARYGLLIDNILEYEMVDADGNAVVASSTQNPDLFWGIRGMGAGYLGIITSIKAKTFRADNIQLTTLIRIYPTSQFEELMKALQSWMEWVGEDHSTFSGFYLTNDNYTSTVPKFLAGGIQLALVHINDPNDLSTRENISQTAFLAKARQIFSPDYTTEEVLYTSYIEHVFFSSYYDVQTDSVRDTNSKTEKNEFALPPEETILQLMAGVRKEDILVRYFREKSMYVKRKLYNAEIERLAALLERIPNNNVWITLNSERGALASLPKNEMAFVHRDSLFTLIVHVETPEVNDLHGIGEADEWFGEWWGAMDSFDGGETYQNYPDLDIPEAEAQQRYFASNLARMVITKRTWDPENYFQNPISIPIYL